MRIRSLAAAGLALLALAGCSTSPGPSSSPARLEGTATIAAAASLQNAFTEIGDRFEDEHPGVTLEFAFAGSSALVAQLQEGAPGDVFASADVANMDEAAELLASEPERFASNTLTIVTPPGNPAGIETFADLASARLVVCAEQVPCGAATASEATAAGVALSPASEEQSVTDVLGRVTSGEADAGLVYVTDAEAAGDAVERIDFDTTVVNEYPIAALTDSEVAAAFIAFVLGDEGRAVLASYGFGAP
ncbi:molybdate ABC transporter substrate-binding protein [Arenivirga flava]|uniref:Molybdate-binding protein n=1 Tax=Arenivirga flava TaxID=1930060 RepID=A0AA37UGX8_9MICO|nr:molybdate ABC transporter substrate-binding protein [Arenivirga flava]GMA28598.1 molybdate-binding protein [Arenivirga flava]